MNSDLWWLSPSFIITPFSLISLFGLFYREKINCITLNQKWIHVFTKSISMLVNVANPIGIRTRLIGSSLPSHYPSHHLFGSRPPLNWMTSKCRKKCDWTKKLQNNLTAIKTSVYNNNALELNIWACDIMLKKCLTSYSKKNMEKTIWNWSFTILYGQFTEEFEVWRPTFGSFSSYQL